MQENVVGNKFSSQRSQNKETNKDQGVAEYISLNTYKLRKFMVFKWQKVRINLLDRLR